MDHMRVLKRAWHILWSYRALWIFGIILALTASSGSNGGGRGNVVFSGNGNGQGSQFGPPSEMGRELARIGEGLNRFFEQVFEGGETPGWLPALGIGLGCLALFAIVAAVIARLVATVALIRMVDGYEATGERSSVRQGFRLGWSRRAWRLFLINLIIVVPLVVGFTLMALLAAAPLLAWLWNNTAVGILGTVAAIGLFFIALCVMIVVGVVAQLLTRFAQRACTVEDLGVFESIRRGYAVVRHHLRDVGLMWLIMLGLGIGYTILVIPLLLILLVAGGAIAGVLVLLARGIAAVFADGALPWVIGGIVGAPVFLAVLAVPLAFLGGLYEVFGSTTWTLTYRELAALEPPHVETPAVPAGTVEAEGEAEV